jgi:hypothetical protein
MVLLARKAPPVLPVQMAQSVRRVPPVLMVPQVRQASMVSAITYW